MCLRPVACYPGGVMYWHSCKPGVRRRPVTTVDAPLLSDIGGVRVTENDDGPKQRDAETRAALDVAVRKHAESEVDDGEVITDWIVLAGTRSYEGGGAVIHMVSDESLPQWIVRGMLATGMNAVDRIEAADQ